MTYHEAVSRLRALVNGCGGRVLRIKLTADEYDQFGIAMFIGRRDWYIPKGYVATFRGIPVVPRA